MDALNDWDKGGRAQQAAHLVFLQLRDEILSLALPPGTALRGRRCSGATG